MIYNYCITCEHYNDRNNFPEKCYGCINGRNYEVNHYYDMTKEDIENMIKNEEDDMNKESNCEPFKIDFVESDIIDELLALTKKNNEMLIDIQKRLDESEGLIWPKRSSDDDVFDEEETVEDIIRDQEREDKYVEDFRSFIETRNRILKSQMNNLASNSFYEIDRKLLDDGWNINKKGPCASHRSCSDCVHANTAFNAEPCNSCEGYTNYKERQNGGYIDKQFGAIISPYDCDNCKHASKMIFDEPCYSCSILNGNYKFEPMSRVDRMEKTIRDAFANCANAVKEFNRRFNESKEKK